MFLNSHSFNLDRQVGVFSGHKIGGSISSVRSAYSPFIAPGFTECPSISTVIFPKCTHCSEHSLAPIMLAVLGSRLTAVLSVSPNHSRQTASFKIDSQRRSFDHQHTIATIIFNRFNVNMYHSHSHAFGPKCERSGANGWENDCTILVRVGLALVSHIFHTGIHTSRRSLLHSIPCL